MSSFSLYLIGFVVAILALAYGAYLLGAPPTWIVIGALLLIGIAIARGATHTKRQDPPAT